MVLSPIANQCTVSLVVDTVFEPLVIDVFSMVKPVVETENNELS